MTEDREGIKYAKIWRDTYDSINSLSTLANRRKAVYALVELQFDGHITDEEKLPAAVKTILPWIKNAAGVQVRAINGGNASAKSAKKRGRHNFEPSESMRKSSDYQSGKPSDFSNGDCANEQRKPSDGLANGVSKPRVQTQSQDSDTFKNTHTTRQPQPVGEWCPWMEEEDEDGFLTLEARERKKAGKKVFSEHKEPSRIEALERSYQHRSETDKPNVGFSRFMDKYVRRDACEGCDGSCVDSCFDTCLSAIAGWDPARAPNPGALASKNLEEAG